jgi:hypothetical protein
MADTETKRHFDLTPGLRQIDCNLHCPSLKLEEEYPNTRYVSPYHIKVDDDSNKKTAVCVAKGAPQQFESCPRLIDRVDDAFEGHGNRRVCVYWAEEIHGHSIEEL